MNWIKDPFNFDCRLSSNFKITVDSILIYFEPGEGWRKLISAGFF
jgi:hypothetical protein